MQLHAAQRRHLLHPNARVGGTDSQVGQRIGGQRQLDGRLSRALQQSPQHIHGAFSREYQNHRSPPDVIQRQYAVFQLGRIHIRLAGVISQGGLIARRGVDMNAHIGRVQGHGADGRRRIHRRLFLPSRFIFRGFAAFLGLRRRSGRLLLLHFGGDGFRRFQRRHGRLLAHAVLHPIFDHFIIKIHRRVQRRRIQKAQRPPQGLQVFAARHCSFSSFAFTTCTSWARARGR